MMIPVLRLKNKEEKRILAGHLWVFSNEIGSIEGTPGVGNIVEVRSARNVLLGFGFYNPGTLIAVRIISKEFVEPDLKFFADRLSSAMRLRRRLFSSNFYRLVYGESDFLPGLVVDRFDSLFSVQILSAGMEMRKDLIYQAIKDVFSPSAIYERNESQTRTLEGLQQGKSIVYGEEKSADYDEDGVVFRINPYRGQKTGFYFDQRLNRIFSRRFAEGAKVLDLYSNEGGFALNLSRSGASSVKAIDASGEVIESLAANAELNSLKNVEMEASDADVYMKKAIASGEKYDVVVCDPPSFTRNRKSVPAAKAAYRKLHEQVFQILNHEGILLTASCSHHIFRETFEEVISSAAGRTGRTLQLLHRAGASPDHPVLPSMPETEYLKFNAYRVI